MDVEVPLAGGRMTAGVVRIGDTVRRPITPTSDFVAALLELLRRRGFAGAPRYLGRDEARRDVLSYLPGDVPARFGRWTTHQVSAAAGLLRAMHDATRDSALAAGRPVICHHDPGPNNTVFRDGTPVAFIDFDAAAPGEPLEDLGYLAWTWCVSSKPDAPPPEVQARQVRAAADAYRLGPGERGELLDAILERQLRNVRFWQGHLTGDSPRIADRQTIAERIAWSQREHAYTAEHRATFAMALARLVVAR